jgi:tetratricopeptide (TPR) repeat protein
MNFRAFSRREKVAEGRMRGASYMRSRFLLTLIALLLLTFFARAQEDMPEVARSLMEEAEHARDAGRADEAIAKYTRAIEVAPQLASAYINLGAIYFKQGKVDKAHATFVKGVENAPADRTLLSNAAATAQQLGKSDEALTFVDRAIEKNKRDAGLFSLRGTILRSLNRNDEALVALQEAVKLAPDDAKVYFSLGNQLYQLNRKDEAINAYGRAVTMDKNFIRAYYNLGAVLFETGRYDEALSAYKMALAPIEQSFAKHESVDPIHARAYANLGGIYLHQKQWQPAIEAYTKALRLDSSSTTAHYNLGFIYFTTNQPQRAEDEYRKALAADPTLPLAYLHLGEIAFKRGDYENALKLLRDGLPRYDADSKLIALRTIGRAELARGNRDAARSSFESALHEKPDDVDSLLLLGRVQRQDQKYAEARTTIERAQKLAPNNNAVTLERVLVAKAANDLGGEKSAIEELFTRDPQHAASLRAEYESVLLRMGNIDAARKEGALRGPLVDAVMSAMDGKREQAARTLAQMTAPIARGDAGLLLWQLGRGSEAKAHLAAAHAAFADWNEIALAAGEVAIGERRNDDAIELLSAVKCDAAPANGVSGTSVTVTMGKNDDLCARTRAALSIALVGRAAELIAENGSPRQARALLDRVNDERLRATSLYLRGRADLLSGDDSAGREAIARAIMGLPPSLAAIAKKDLEATAPAEPETPPADATSSQVRRTIVVFLPDAPAETEKKIAEASNALVAQWSAAANIPLQAQLFRRADDARTFALTNKDSVGVVIGSSEFVRTIGSELTPRYQFTRDGSASYHRVVVVPAKSAIKSFADLKLKTISGVEGIGDANIAVTTHVPDDLTALANALYGKTDAALVSEDNALLAQHKNELRVIHTTNALPLPVMAFAPMPADDRNALDTSVRALRAAPVMSGVIRIGERVVESKKRELAPLSVSAVVLPKLAPPPANVALRVAVELPKGAVPEEW